MQTPREQDEDAIWTDAGCTVSEQQDTTTQHRLEEANDWEAARGHQKKPQGAGKEQLKREAHDFP